MNIIFEVWCLVASWVVDIWVSSTSFQKREHWLASTASDRKCTIYQWKFWFLMIHSTKNDRFMVILVWFMIKLSGSGWVNRAVETVEASEVAEAIESMRLWQVNFFFVRFFGEARKTKIAFEIIWPLAGSCGNKSFRIWVQQAKQRWTQHNQRMY